MININQDQSINLSIVYIIHIKWYHNQYDTAIMKDWENSIHNILKQGQALH